MKDMIYATLPINLTIGDIVCVQHYKDDRFCIYQNYSLPRPTSDQPLIDDTPHIIGRNMFHLFRVIHRVPGEQLGECLGSYDSVQQAMAEAARSP